MKTIPLLLISAALATACSSTPPAPASAPNASVDAHAAPAVAAAVQATAPKIGELDDPNSLLAKRSVYFPYDDFAVDSKYDDTLRAHAGYMGRHPEARMTIEGNADERGSHEYNLALGQKRAEAVKRMLVINGAAEKQVEAISYGEERPKAECPEERCWQQNRRDDLVYGVPHQ
jgi:peptidoglycan-associated lipoprotein